MITEQEKKLIVMDREIIIQKLADGGYSPVGETDPALRPIISSEINVWDKHNHSLAVLPPIYFGGIDERQLVIPYGRVINQPGPYLDRDTILAQNELRDYCVKQGIPFVENYSGDSSDLEAFVEIFARLKENTK